MHCHFADGESYVHFYEPTVLTPGRQDKTECEPLMYENKNFRLNKTDNFTLWMEVDKDDYWPCNVIFIKNNQTVLVTKPDCC